ncbi:MAG: hypothetical protein HFH14_09080 [Lachnospiraceae bacterium]|nr:hypothetical protein [Lachnospiraceae bacterium]
MYSVPHMKDACEYIAYIIDKRKKNLENLPTLTDEYIRMFDIIAHSEGFRQAGWEYCLNAGELKLLAQYIFSGDMKKPAEIQALLSPYRRSGNITYIKLLYLLWQDHFDNSNYVHIFYLINEYAEFRAYFSVQFGMDTSELARCIEDGRVTEYFCRIAGIDSNGEYNTYCDNLRKCGIEGGTLLYRECVNRYVLVCDGKAYLKMGADVIIHFMNTLSRDERVVMMRNMLKALDSFQMKKLVSIFPLFRDYAGDNDSDSYKEIFSFLSEEDKKKYLLWQNQYYIYSVLGEGEKADFWMGYAGRGTFTKHGYAGVIYLCFSGFTVIEFRNTDVAYFFNSDYFNKMVEPYVCNLQNERDIEEWIYGNTEWSLDKTHQDHWRKAHIGPWQLDMKSYMGRNLVRI